MLLLLSADELVNENLPGKQPSGLSRIPLGHSPIRELRDERSGREVHGRRTTAHCSAGQLYWCRKGRGAAINE